MAAERASVSVDILRETAQQKVEATSLRRVADELGMSPNGLRSFLLGGAPYSPTRQKLLAWYVRESGDSAYETVTTETADAALSLLVRHLPTADRDAAKTALRDAIAALSRARKARQPRWLR